ncbi:protein TolA, partial [Priestia megaterium]
MPFNTRNTGDRPKKIRILGYRSGTSSKMFIASIVYILLFLLLFRTILPTSTFNVFMSIGIIGFLLSILALIIGLIKPSIVLPKAEYKTRKKAVYYYSFSFIAFFLLAIFFTVEEPTSAEKSAVTKCESSEARSEITQLAEKKSKLEEDIKKLNKEKEKLSAETEKLTKEKEAKK